MQRSSRLLLLALLCLGTGTAVHAIPLFTEAFSTPGSVSGWVGWPTGELSLSEDGGTLVCTFASLQSSGAIASDGATSGGRFAGNLTAGGAEFFGMDIRPDPGTEFNLLNVYVDSPDSTWSYNLTGALPQAGVWTHYELLFDANPGHWVHQMGPETLQQTLSNASALIVEIGVVDGGGAGRIDNLELARTPEPATLLLVAGGVGAMALRRRRRETQ